MKATSAAFARLFKSSPADWTREDLTPLTGPELEVCCKLMGIPHTGTNPQKQDRLLTCAGVRDVLSICPAGHAGAAEMAAHFKKPELEAYTRSVGAFYSLPAPKPGDWAIDALNVCDLSHPDGDGAATGPRSSPGSATC